MLYLQVKNRDKTLYEGNVDNVSAYNKVGLFSVLTDHSNFISIIENKIIITKSGAHQEIIIDNGLVKVRGNKVWVYVGIK